MTATTTNFQFLIGPGAPQGVAIAAAMAGLTSTQLIAVATALIAATPAASLKAALATVAPTLPTSKGSTPALWLNTATGALTYS